jgi:hypothetical protein
MKASVVVGVGVVVGAACGALAQTERTGAQVGSGAERPPAVDAEKLDAAQVEDGDGKQPGFTLSFTPRGEYTFGSDLRDSMGSVSVSRAGVGIDASGPLGDRARLSVGADFESSWYDFKDAGDLLPSGKEPIEDAFLLRVTPGISYFLSRQLAVVGGAIVEVAGAYGADLGDSVTYGGYGGVRYQASETFAVTAGVIVKTRLEDDAIVVPLLGLNWKIDEKLSLSSEGLGARLAAKVSPQWTVSVFGRWELREYRLEDDGAIPDGIVRDTRVPVGAGVTWSPTERVSVTLSGGVVVYQRFQFDDRDGNGVANDRTRGAGFVGVRGEIRF